MATRKPSTKAAVLETESDETTEVAAPTTKTIVNDAINSVVEATGLDGQKARYKAMRAIAFQAFTEAIESGDFDELVQRSIANADSLPAGWGLERTVAEEKAAKAPVKATKAAPKAATKAPAKRASTKAAAATEAKPARKRPAR